MGPSASLAAEPPWLRRRVVPGTRGARRSLLSGCGVAPGASPGPSGRQLCLGRSI